MSARWGERVVATELAVRSGALTPGRTGILVHAEGLRVWVIPSGNRTVGTYHRDFWAPVPVSQGGS